MPPGYTPYNTNPVATHASRIAALAKAIQILVVIVIASNVLSLVVTLSVNSTFGDYLDGNASQAEAEDAINKIAGAGFAGVGWPSWRRSC